MPLETIDLSGLPEGTEELLLKALHELQSLKIAIVAGAGVATNITIAGLKTTDTILSVIRFDVAADTGTSATGNKVAGVSDLTAEASIPTATHLQLGTTDTTGDTLLVHYYSKPAS